MDETHNHEWYWDEVVDVGTLEVHGIDYMCECGEELSRDEIVRRLNATEVLSANDAEWAGDELEERCGDAGLFATLWIYARILRGE